MSKNDNESDNFFQKHGTSDNSLANQSAVSSFPRLNKLKIVGNGMNNWSVATCGPFYLIDADQNTSANINPTSTAEITTQPLTGATNLITHYGLLSTYHKFCGRPFKETLSSFLPNIPGNLDVSISNEEEFKDGIKEGLMELSRKPPVQKEILTFSSSSLAEAFRLYNEKLPNYAKYFTNETQHSIGNDDRGKHKSSENKKRKRRDSNLTFTLNELNSGNPISANADSNPTLSNPNSNLHDNISQHGLPIPTKIATVDSTSKMISPGTSLYSNQNPSTVLISPLTIKAKKSKRSDDEEKRKKKKKEKKKKKDRNID